jgi:hypothetical protein
MLDYAANAIAYWPVDSIKDQFEKRCLRDDVDPSQVFMECFGVETNEDELWGKVDTNLHAGKVRMLFVADWIPDELRNIVEFLNRQMDPAEVLAVELKHYTGEGKRILVPQVLGLIPAKKEKKQNPWTSDEVVHNISMGQHPDDVSVAKQIVEWGKSKSLSFTGTRGATATVIIGDSLGNRVYITEGSPNPRVDIGFEKIKSLENGIEILTEFCKRANRIHGVNVSPDKTWLCIRLSLLKDEKSWDYFIDAMAFLSDQLAIVK